MWRRAETKRAEKVRKTKPQSWSEFCMTCRWRECETNRKEGEHPVCLISTYHCSPNWCLPGAMSLFFFWLVMRRSCLIVGPAGRALIAAAYLSRQNVAKPTGLQCERENGGTFGNEEILILVIMIQNGSLSSTKYDSQVVLACLLYFHWQWMWFFFFFFVKGCKRDRSSGIMALEQI